MDEIMAHLQSHGKPVSQETAEEIVALLETEKNYIPESEVARREFVFLLLKEYRTYVESQALKNPLKCDKYP